MGIGMRFVNKQSISLFFQKKRKLLVLMVLVSILDPFTLFEGVNLNVVVKITLARGNVSKRK